MGRGARLRGFAEIMDFQEATQERRGDPESLFEGRGGLKHCRRMAWRPKAKGVGRLSNAAKKGMPRGFVDSGTPVGLLGYEDGEPVAWRSIAPRDSYRRMSRTADPDCVDSASVWAIARFFAIQRRGDGGSLSGGSGFAKLQVHGDGSNVPKHGLRIRRRGGQAPPRDAPKTG